MRKRVELSFVLDETGSMGSIRTDTIGSFNHFLEDQLGLDADISFSLVLFSLLPDESRYRQRYESVPMGVVQPLSEDSYRPRGNTPLYDAIGSTIDSLGTRLAGMAEADRPDQVIVCVLTDGEENSSSEYTLAKVREMVSHQRDAYQWEFVFMGCGIDAYEVGGGLAMATAYTSSHAADSKGVAEAFTTATSRVRSLVGEKETTR